MRVSWCWLVAVAAALEPGTGSEAPRRPECRVDRCHYTGNTVDEHVFTIDGSDETVLWEWSGDEYAKLRCPSPLAADDPLLPAFPAPLPARRVTLAHCRPPASWGAALAALGLRPPPRRLDLLELTSLSGDVAAWSRLPGVRELRLRAAAAGAGEGGEREVELPAGAALPDDVRTLRLDGVRARWDALPAALRSLSVASAAAVDARGLRAAELTSLRLSGTPLVALWEEDALPRLEEASLRGASGAAVERAGRVWRGSAGLRTVEVVGRRDARSLPARWLAGRTALTSLRLAGLGATTLPDSLLEGCGALTSLDVRDCSLREFPGALLRDAPALLTLRLDDNRLTVLPETLGKLTSLRELSASRNLLTSLPASWSPGLRALRLDYNPLGDLCSGALASSSPLRSATSLRVLSLVGVGASRLCVDWRLQLVRLHTLHLQHNNITLLQSEDLKWVRSGEEAGSGAEVQLGYNPLTSLVYSREDYVAAARRHENVAPVTLNLTGCPLECDCRMYWAVKGVRAGAGAGAVRVSGARCGGGGVPLSEVRVEELECVTSQCPAGCECAVRPSEAPAVRAACTAVPVLAAWRGPPLRLRVEGAGLTSLPRPPPAVPALLLPHNRIDHVSAGDLLPVTREVDLSNNSLSFLSLQEGEALLGASETGDVGDVGDVGEGRGGRRLLLGGNPWRCACVDLDLLLLLRAHSQQIEDWESLRCEDGREMRLVASREAACGGPGAGAGALRGAGGAAGAALLLLAGAGAALLYKYRHYLKMYLRARGYCGCGAAAAGAGAGAGEVAAGVEAAGEEAGEEERYLFDVFVSYSHVDASWVETWLVPVLERELAQRVLVHYREWAAGGWIPAQIARSVRVSRRTLAVLSRSSLAARWPSAELSLALSTAPRRLLLLLLEEPDVLLPPGPALTPADALLDHLSSTTYLRRDDPLLRDKLARALPPPLPSLPAPATPATPAPTTPTTPATPASTTH